MPHAVSSPQSDSFLWLHAALRGDGHHHVQNNRKRATSGRSNCKRTSPHTPAKPWQRPCESSLEMIMRSLPKCREHQPESIGINAGIDGQPDARRQLDPDLGWGAGQLRGRRQGRCRRHRIGNADLGEHRPGCRKNRYCHRPASQLARHRLPPSSVNLPARNLVQIHRRADATASAKGITQDRQLLLDRPVSAA